MLPRSKPILALCAGLTVFALFSNVAHAAILLFDFGSAGSQSSSTSYNNILGGTTSVADLIDSSGGNTGYSFAMSGFNSGSNTVGTTSPTGAAAIFASTATQDSVFGHAETFDPTPPRPLGVITLTGLDSSGNTFYSFDFFASRTGVSDNRTTLYAVTGANSGSALLNATGNTSNLATVMNILPDNTGKITLELSKGTGNNNTNGFFYINAMRITTSAVPEPGRMMLLGLAGAAVLLRRRRGVSPI